MIIWDTVLRITPTQGGLARGRYHLWTVTQNLVFLFILTSVRVLSRVLYFVHYVQYSVLKVQCSIQYFNLIYVTFSSLFF